MNKCVYCGLEARTDYPVEFRCGSVTNRDRSKACMEKEIGLLNERVERLEEALDTLTLVVGLTPIAGNKDALQEAMDIARSELKAKESKP